MASGGFAILAAAATLVALSGCPQPRDPPPQAVLEPPDWIDEYIESLFMRAHLYQLIRSLDAHDDVVFEHRDKVGKHLAWVMAIDLRLWDKSVQVGELWLSREVESALYRTTAGATEYQGARERAVALGLLAQSLWRRNPPPHDPSEYELDVRASKYAYERWDTEPALVRAVALKRMILIGLYADRWLFQARSGPLGPGDWK